MNKKKSMKYLGLILPIILLTAGFSACDTIPIPKIPYEIDSSSQKISEQSANTLHTSSVSNPPEKNTMITHIDIYKSERILNLYIDGKLVNTFKIALGSAPVGDKNKQGDKRTPTGSYYVCNKNDQSRFTLSLGVSYPNVSDAKRGLENGLIDENIYKEIVKANETMICPSWQTPLGGLIGIHGGGNESDWTLGCIALSEKDIRTLWQYVELKTPINIYE